MSESHVQTVEKIPVMISSGSYTSTSGEVRVVHWPKSQRRKRAFRLAGIFFVLGVVSLAIPGLHFILTPAFLLATPVVFFLQLGKDSEIEGGEGTCPGCSAPIQVMKEPVRWPLTQNCSQCSRQLYLNKDT